MPTDGFYEFLGSISPYDTPFVVTATKPIATQIFRSSLEVGDPKAMGYDSYQQQITASLRNQQRLMEQMRQGWPYATASASSWPQNSNVVVDAAATVETPTKTVIERKRERRKVNYLYWLSVLVASIISIWPAWGPRLVWSRPAIDAVIITFGAAGFTFFVFTIIHAIRHPN